MGLWIFWQDDAVLIKPENPQTQKPYVAIIKVHLRDTHCLVAHLDCTYGVICKEMKVMSEGFINFLYAKVVWLCSFEL